MPGRKSEHHSEALHEHAEWEWQFEQVARFVHQRGHCDLGAHPAAVWLRQQRLAAMLGALTSARRERLLGLGVQLEEEDAAWDAMLERLRARADDKTTTRADDLPAWCDEQRALIAAGKLRADRRERVTPLLLADQPETRHARRLQASWQQRFEQLVAFQKQHGHNRTPKSFDLQLWHWRHVQREQRRKGLLSAERVTCLDSIGFEWEKPGREGRSVADWHERRWEERFARLLAFKTRFGHAQVPVKWPEDKDLANWVTNQRHTAQRGRLSAARRQRLDAIGFVWNANKVCKLPPFPPARRPPRGYIALWDRRFAELAAFKEQHGHTQVRKADGKQLWHWREVQREFRRRGKLSAERIARLDSIGFEWGRLEHGSVAAASANQQRWDARFARLCAYRERFGHSQVPAHWAEDTSLASWVAEQRKHARRGTLPADRRQRLDAIGFVWQTTTRPTQVRGSPQRHPSPTLAERWERRYAELVAFHQQHGHTRVPNKRADVAPLCTWCYSQRAFRRAGTLSAARIARLDALGFHWQHADQPDAATVTWTQHLWDQHYARLVAFKARFGHARVPITWREDRTLVRWVEKQRKAAREGRLSAARRQRLDDLGFIWKPDHTTVFTPRPDQTIPKPMHDAIWLRHYEELLAFQKQHGSLQPSKRHDPRLYLWCSSQRQRCRLGKLAPERKTRLDAIGFPW